MNTFTDITPEGFGYTAELYPLGLLIRGEWRTVDVPRIQGLADTNGFTQNFPGIAHAAGAAFAFSRPDIVGKFRADLGAPLSIFDFDRSEKFCPAMTALWVTFTGDKSRLGEYEPTPPATVQEFAQCLRFLELIKQKQSLLDRVQETFLEFAPFVRQWSELTELFCKGDLDRLNHRLLVLGEEVVPF